MFCAFLMLGTTRLREPSALVRSIARPRLTESGFTRVGLPSTTANEAFISGCSASARTIAYPMRCVKLTLPPRPRVRWLLITIRLSAISFAGTARTLVAVGTVSEASMFAAMRAATPRIGLVLVAVAAVAPSGVVPAALAGAAGFACVVGLAAVAGAVGRGAAGAVGAAVADAAGPAVGAGAGAGAAAGAAFVVPGGAATVSAVAA